ncbi:MAG: FimB/Mfa2 family fimbrial subunit [Bacteroidales bacterium]|nr:FimB/Mfa2 family fimbrial subunit [Bacteroidales bacterium]
MRIYPAILLATLLLVCGSCAEKEPLGQVQGRVEVSITTGELQTKAPSGNPADGGGIIVDGNGKPDLVIAIANSGGSLVAWYPEDFFDASMSDDYSSECNTTLTNGTTSTVFFTGLLRANGPYTVYAVANTAGLPSGVLTSLKACTTAAQMDDLQLSVASGQPAFEDGSHNECMPITAKGTLTILASGNGQVDLQLLRPVARISVTFKNETGGNIDVHSCNVVIGDINPSCGYLFQQSPDEVSGYGRSIEIAAPVIGGNDKLVFDAQNKSTLGTVQVFPSVAPARQVGSRYLCTISFRVTKSEQNYNAGDNTTYDEYSFPDLPIHDSRSSDILYLGRNQHLKIETRITKQASTHDYSFNFEVQNWDTKDNYMTFD